MCGTRSVGNSTVPICKAASNHRGAMGLLNGKLSVGPFALMLKIYDHGSKTSPSPVALSEHLKPNNFSESSRGCCPSPERWQKSAETTGRQKQKPLSSIGNQIVRLRFPRKLLCQSATSGAAAASFFCVCSEITPKRLSRSQTYSTKIFS